MRSSESEPQVGENDPRHPDTRRFDEIHRELERLERREKRLAADGDPGYDPWASSPDAWEGGFAENH